MSVPIILCKAKEYHSAGEAFGDCATESGSVHSGLVGVLTANAGMAGSDSTGEDWARPYDEAAKLAIATSSQLVTAFGQVRELVVNGAYNHEVAEAKANHKEVPPPPKPAPTPPANLSQEVPSAQGHGIPEPFGWSIIKDIVGALWPNGDQDKLRAAGTAWHIAAGDFHTIAGEASQGITLLSKQKSVEIETAVQTSKDRQSDLNDLGDACQSLGDACNEYANHLDEAHKKIIEELAEFAAEAVAGEVIFAILAPFTAGISEAVGNSALAARIAMKARRVATIIGELATKIGTLIGRAVRPLIEKLKPLFEKVRQWVEAAKTKLGKTKEPGGKEPEHWPKGKGKDSFEALSEEEQRRLKQELMTDSNKAFPLSEANAEKILRSGPPGTKAEVAGPGGAGADVKFVDEAGNVVARTESKAINGGPNSFNKELSHASKQVEYEGQVHVQVPEGTKVEEWMHKFQGSRNDQQLGKYSKVDVVFSDPAGNVLGKYNAGTRIPR
ncbi:hypothetical protein DFR70_12172 [Nocardia tenerifensis]|uniref:Outer membrane channel protein CpnT-like N-terminal domain-containing protein n=1 Tax=Nocardia tenerifensis TaxID=228006 RepID=A0A318JUA3_9NOCA|nr:hypothetical protein [Nocardia tenerifensis]PXX55603.1 hypothetical protein DFR70_12172 [Nocardia tenerifensis]